MLQFNKLTLNGVLGYDRVDSSTTSVNITFHSQHQAVIAESKLVNAGYLAVRTGIHIDVTVVGDLKLKRL